MAAGKSPSTALQRALTQWASQLRDSAVNISRRAAYAERMSQAQAEYRVADDLSRRADLLLRLAAEVGR